MYRLIRFSQIQLLILTVLFISIVMTALYGSLAITYAKDSVPAIPSEQRLPTHILTFSDELFEDELSMNEMQERWRAGQPVFVQTAASDFEQMQVVKRTIAGESAPLAATQASSQTNVVNAWDEDYYQTSFESDFLANEETCAWELTRKAETEFGWKRDTNRAQSGTFALWPDGPDKKYDNNIETALVCELVEMQDVDNILIEFSMWYKLADQGDELTVSISVDDGDYRGIRWAGGESGATFSDWSRYRIFYPNPNANKILIRWHFKSDGSGTDEGPWIDDLSVQRYSIPSTSVGCEDFDPTINVKDTPGDVAVSKGLNVPPYLEDPLNDRIQRLIDSQVNWVRLELIASPNELSGDRALNALLPGRDPTQIDFKHYDQIIDSLCAQGIAVLGLVDYQTLTSREWQSDDAAGALLSQEYITQFAGVTGQMVHYFSNRIGSWEIWNEPDFSETGLQPASYAELLVAAHDEILEADSGDIVVFGGLGGADFLAENYLEELYPFLIQEAGSSSTPFDIFALHPYLSNQYDIEVNPNIYIRSQARDEGSEQGPTIIHKFLQIMADNGDTNKEVWVTELGWNSARNTSSDAAEDTLSCPETAPQVVTRQQQANFLRSSFDILFQETAWDHVGVLEPSELGSIPSVTKVFWYQYRDTAVFVECQNGAIASWSPSWNASYVAMSPAVSASELSSDEEKKVDWWYGLYDGAFEAKKAQKTFFCYPRDDSDCFTDSYLPSIIQGVPSSE